MSKKDFWVNKLSYILKILAVIFGILIVSSFLIFTTYPILSNLSISNFLKFKISSIQKYNAYYLSIYVFYSIIITFCGLILGYIYYTHRIKTEDKRNEKERHEKRIDWIINKLELYEYNVKDIIDLNFTNDNQLKKLQDEAERSIDTIYMIIELITCNYPEYMEYLNSIFDLSSYVNSHFLLEYSSEDLTSINYLYDVKNEFLNKCTEAKRVCINAY